MNRKHRSFPQFTRILCRRGVFGIVLGLLAGVVSATAVETVWLGSLDLATMQQGWGKPQVNRSVTGKPLSIGGRHFDRGVGTHANGTFAVSVGGAQRFLATVGLDDDTGGPGSVEFQLIADGKKIFDSGVMTSATPPRPVDVDLRGVKLLVLKVTDAGDGGAYDHADWADARFIVSGAKPVAFLPKPEKPYLLTPKPGPAPRINGPTVYGCRPGHPFLYRIPCQGKRPIRFSAKGLPASLKLDADSGIITGTVPARGKYEVLFTAKNSYGRSSRNFKIDSGDTLALTPPMGFNDWYAYYRRVTETKMEHAADVLISSGMADVGYQYVNVDDCWMGPRDAAGHITGNTNFPDMKALADYIHRLGLKAGLYTSPGPRTCAGYTGSYQHEAEDARQFADWGFDFLKYDWCSYGKVLGHPATLEEMKRPYILMGNLLKQQNRDIVFNLCQYGMGQVWKWGAEVGGQSWRTAGDLGPELNNFFGVALKNCEHRDWQRPGAWNDPDYIQIGYIGGRHGFVPCPLTPNEQYAFMSLWCLMASPLFYSGDMSKLDAFTLNVLCNPEVIEVDQDPLGKCARVVKLDDERFLMIKDMADGSKAVGLCNRGEFEAPVSASWKQLGVSGRQRVRDLWREKDLGIFQNQFKTTVPRHAVVLVRLWPSK